MKTKTSFVLLCFLVFQYSLFGQSQMLVEGSLKIEKELSSDESPDKNVIYGNSMPVAYGNITIGGSIQTDFGIVSVTNPNTGEYDIVLNQSFSSFPVVIVTCINSTPNDEVATYSWVPSTPNEIEINISNGTGAPTGSQFSFVVFGNVLIIND